MKTDNKIPVDIHRLKEIFDAMAKAISRKFSTLDPDYTQKCIRQGVYEGMGLGLHLYGRADITCKPMAEILHSPEPQRAAEYLLTQRVQEFPRENPQHPGANER